MPKQQILQMNQIDYRFFEKARQVAMISDYHKTHVDVLLYIMEILLALDATVIRHIQHKIIIINTGKNPVSCFQNYTPR